jgi:IS5 family transposase
MKQFKRHKDYGFFDQDIRLSRLSQLGDPLERLNKGIDFEIFREILEKNLIKLAKGKGGRPSYDYVLMFKILILQRYYNLSDDQVEYQINDRMSFMRFLDLTIADDVPDSKTVWNFREQLIDLAVIEELFNRFIKELEKLNLIINAGKIIAASFVEVPVQRNTKEEDEEIKNGGNPAPFNANPHVKSQKDIDARWTKKNNMVYFGYKNHIKVDSASKLITGYLVTNASKHDSQVLDELLDSCKDKGQDLYGDSAYGGTEQLKIIADKEMTARVGEQGYKNRPLTDMQKAGNKEKSRTRARVEHVFGFIEMSMNGMHLNVIGIKRIKGVVGLMNLTWNMFRKIQLT